MRNEIIDSLLWESIPMNNLIVQSGLGISQENLDEIPIDQIDELYISRDEHYNIKIICTKTNGRHDNGEIIQQRQTQQPYVAGKEIKPGKIVVKPFGNDYCIELSPCYYIGQKRNQDKTDYKLSCYHVKCRYIEKETKVLKEWVLNGGQSGLRFCDNKKIQYTVESSIVGTYGDLDFPIKKECFPIESYGTFIHLKFQNTAFDVSFIGNSYGPEWSDNISISYFEEYGRIPSEEERKIIRSYLSFFMGRELFYVGNSTYDEKGDLLGFEMDSPNTYGFEIERICRNGGNPPISDKYEDRDLYFESVQKYIDRFAFLYEYLDFEDFFISYWYTKNLAKPYDLPILASAIQGVMKKWYEQVEDNPETVRMDKKEFNKRIKPIKNKIADAFEGTELAERIQYSLDGINRMSISEQLSNFFEKIGITIGNLEKKALQARNNVAHGSVRTADGKYAEQITMSRVYDCIIVRVILYLLGYEGKYVDYGTLGYPQKDIKTPSGEMIVS